MFNSSYNDQSRIYRFTNEINERFANNEQVEVTYRSALNTKMEAHDGTTKYYDTGIHDQDTSDDIHLIKKEILESDIIVLATPVYCHMVSSAMAVFVERVFSNWVHLFRILGKPYVILTSSESNGNAKAYSYLSGNLEIAGGFSLGHYEFKTTNFNDEVVLKDLIEKLVSVLEDGVKFELTSKQEAAFQTYKVSMSLYDTNHYERKYWESTGLLYADSLTEYVESKLKIV